MKLNTHKNLSYPIIAGILYLIYLFLSIIFYIVKSNGISELQETIIIGILIIPHILFILLGIIFNWINYIKPKNKFVFYIIPELFYLLSISIFFLYYLIYKDFFYLFLFDFKFLLFTIFSFTIFLIFLTFIAYIKSNKYRNSIFKKNLV